MSGGLLFAIWLLTANLVNSAMEEGLFRGIMLRLFLVKHFRWGAILLQASLFAAWHLSWPLRHILDGTSTLGEAAFEALVLIVATSVAGIVYGYLYLKTGGLWPCFLAHTINNGIFPTVADVLCYLKGLKPQNLAGVAFGSYGWSGEAVGQVSEILEGMKVELVGEGLKVKYVPDQAALSQCAELGKRIAERQG